MKGETNMYIDNDLKELVTFSMMKTGNNWGTGMLIIHPVTRKILLGKRSDTHNWCSPGGKVEVGESPLQGVLRETLEESNIKVDSCMFYDFEMHVATNGKNWTSFMFASDQFDDSTIKPQESEIEGDWEWFTVEEAMSLDLFPPTRKSLERAIEADVIYMAHQDDNYIPFENCATSASMVSAAHDMCCCAYSYQEPEQIFPTNQGLYWD